MNYHRNRALLLLLLSCSLLYFSFIPDKCCVHPRETMLSAQPRPAGITVTTIHFPSPHPTSFAIAGTTNEYGAPQLTTTAGPQEQPQWNQTMFFLGDKSSLFTTESALVLEYYPASLGKIIVMHLCYNKILLVLVCRKHSLVVTKLFSCYDM